MILFCIYIIVRTIPLNIQKSIYYLIMMNYKIGLILFHLNYIPSTWRVYVLIHKYLPLNTYFHNEIYFMLFNLSTPINSLDHILCQKLIVWLFSKTMVKYQKLFNFQLYYYKLLFLRNWCIFRLIALDGVAYTNSACVHLVHTPKIVNV